MKRKIILIALIISPLFSQAQFGGLLKKVKDKIDKKVDEATDKLINGDPNSSSDARLASAENPSSTPVTSKPVDPLVAYSKFDFVPGEKVIYAEDFSQDVVGEFPLQWTTKGKGEVMTLKGFQGKWLRGFKNSTLTSINKNELGENYTIEFDLVYYFNPVEDTYVMPDLQVRVLNNYTVPKRNASGNVFERDGEQSYILTFHAKNEGSLAWMENYNVQPEFTSDKMAAGDFTKYYNKTMHYAIQVQKSRLRVWLNEKKVFDLPQAINFEKKAARIAFSLGQTTFTDEEVGFYVSNIRMATGNADTRHKLLETGSFSTSGILFDVNSDKIKPESNGILNELIKILNENSTVKIRITGHTSSDGNSSANLELSKKRAQSVKEFMSKAGIDVTRLETTGMGDTKPVALNTTNEGRFQNRRVEFIKL